MNVTGRSVGVKNQIDGLVQNFSNIIANALSYGSLLLSHRN